MANCGSATAPVKQTIIYHDTSKMGAVKSRPSVKVKYFEAADKMVQQLVASLARAEAVSQERYSIVVTGDHSTPVIFGDHSHEPVPFTAAHVSDVVEAIGGQGAIQHVSFSKIAHPSPPDSQPSLQDLGFEAHARRGKEDMFQRPLKGDEVCRFDEIAAAAGCLGRFPGSQVMPLLKQLAKI